MAAEDLSSGLQIRYEVREGEGVNGCVGRRETGTGGHKASCPCTADGLSFNAVQSVRCHLVRRIGSRTRNECIIVGF